METQNFSAGTEFPVGTVTPSEDVAAAEMVVDPCADRLAVASFVCGLIGVILLPLGLIPGFFGFVFYLDARNHGSKNPKLDSGRILCLIAMFGMPLALIAMLTLSCEAALFMI